MTTRAQPILTVERLSIAYTGDGYHEKAVEDASLQVRPGNIVALVGESGSGKTSLARAAVGQLPANAEVANVSRVELAGIDVLGAPRRRLDALRGSVVGFIPQDPRRSLHPLKRIGAQIAEVLHKHRVCAKADVPGRVEALLAEVGIDEPPTRAKQYPHEFSGGMLQRALIAIALAAEPALIIADEPTSALDVTVQKQILALLTRLVADNDIAILLVTHDLAVASQVSDETVVMQRGRIVESRPTAELFARPGSDYTRTLLAASPRIELAERDLPVPPEPAADPVLRVDDVVREIRLRGPWRGPRRYFRPVDDVSFAVHRGQTVGLVGESGAGKSSLGRLALGLDSPDEGQVLFQGRDLATLTRAERRDFRRATHVIPQNPATSFDPRFSVEQIVAEPLLAAGESRSATRARVADLLDQVGLPASFARKGGLELSGGQQQRVAIARAISLNPAFIVCDEPTSALDVTVQARIIELLRRLQRETQVGFLFISHDLAVVSELASHVVVLRRGRMAERGAVGTVLRNPVNPYTHELIDSVPSYSQPWSAA